MVKPPAARQMRRIEVVGPMPVIPTRASDIDPRGVHAGERRLCAPQRRSIGRKFVADASNMHLFRASEVFHALRRKTLFPPCTSRRPGFIVLDGRFPYTLHI